MASRTKLTRAEKLAEKLNELQIERLYYTHCAGIQVDIMDINKIFNVGRAAQKAGDDEETIRDKIVAFVETIRKN